MTRTKRTLLAAALLVVPILAAYLGLSILAAFPIGLGFAKSGPHPPVPSRVYRTNMVVVRFRSHGIFGSIPSLSPKPRTGTNDVVLGFELAGKDRLFVPVEGRIGADPREVYLDIPADMKPCHVRYLSGGNLCAEDWVPVEPFERSL